MSGIRQYSATWLHHMPTFGNFPLELPILQLMYIVSQCLNAHNDGAIFTIQVLSLYTMYSSDLLTTSHDFNRLLLYRSYVLWSTRRSSLRQNSTVIVSRCISRATSTDTTHEGTNTVIDAS